MADFYDLHRKGAYEDKTAALYGLIAAGRTQARYVLSRPNGFGKSTLISALKGMLEGRRELFEGLAVAGTDYDWAPMPVIHMDLARTVADTAEEFERALRNVVADALDRSVLARTVGCDRYADVLFARGLRAMYEKSGDVAVLIDNPEFPVRCAEGKPDLQKAMRETLNGLVIHLKCGSPRLGFLLIADAAPCSELMTGSLTGMDMLRDISDVPGLGFGTDR